MYQFVIDNLPRYLEGALVTIEIAALSSMLGFAIAVPIALMRLSKLRTVSSAATVYMFFFRGTPLLAQIFLIYYGSGQFREALDAVGLWTYFRNPWFCAVLTLTLNTAAYSAEILRGAIQSIPKGEIEAAKVLGLNPFLRLRLIILPRAISIAWPAYTNEIIYQIQATSLVSIITVMDITGVARVVGSRYFTFYEAFGLAAIMYLILVYGFVFVAGRIESRLHAHLNVDSKKSEPLPIWTAR